MAVVALSGLLAGQAGDSSRFELDAATVADALPVADLLFDEHGTLRPLVDVVVDGADARLTQGERSTVRIVPVLAGG